MTKTNSIAAKIFEKRETPQRIEVWNPKIKNYENELTAFLLNGVGNTVILKF